jgi:manganese/zinc/iron transport system substrate-binding protein
MTRDGIRNTRMKIIRSAALLVALAFSTACSPQEEGTGKPLVVTTTTMITDLVRVVAGDRVEVKGLLGPGVDPHAYVPKLGDSRLLEHADAVIYNGLHLEGRMQEGLEAMATRGRLVVAVTSGIAEADLITPQEEFEGTKDPHVWGDPLLWMQAIEPVVDTLTKIDPEGAEEFRARGDAYRVELEELVLWATNRLREVPENRRILVTSHDAFLYFGRAYGFDVRGLQGVSTAAEAGISDRAGLVSHLRQLGVPTVFAETSINEKGIAAVAAEAGVKLAREPLFSDALGKPGDVVTVNGESYDRGTYTGMIKHNVNTIVSGLK